MKITSNLIVDRIEDSLPFWTKLGFGKKVEMPEGDRLGFVILVRDDVELMLQSRASVAKDVPPLADTASRSTLYIEVDDLAPIRDALAGVKPVVPERTTSYGAREIIVRDPAGNAVFFATYQR